MITKEEQKMYPKVLTARYFKFNSDTRNKQNEMYAIEYVARNKQEESGWYESLSHEANIVIETKLPNGVIK